MLISSVPPLRVKTDANLGGLPKDVFDDFQAQTAARHAAFYRELAAGPFYGFNRPGVETTDAVNGDWGRGGPADWIGGLYRSDTW